MEQLEARIEALESQVRELSAQKAAAERRVQRCRGLAAVTAVCALLLCPLVSGWAQDGGGPRTLAARVVALEGLLQHFSRQGNDVYVTGANLHVRNGMRTTASLNGVGNLIVGYNEAQPNDDLNRFGSHNLILGTRHNYGSYGGFVAGAFNTLSAPYASILGGSGNRVEGAQASVCGGRQNAAYAASSSILGGYGNHAGEPRSAPSGGTGAFIGE